MKRLLKPSFWIFLLGCFSPALAQDIPIGALNGLNFSDPAGTYWALPKELKDVSGAALSQDGRLFVVAEERAVIHEIDYINGSIVKTFAFGRPAAKKDFEGIAISGKRFFVINKGGRLLEGREGFNGEGKVFNSYDTGFGEKCKIGGLATTETKLLVLCQSPEKDEFKSALTIFSWDLASKTADPEPFLKMPLEGEETSPVLTKISPSGLEVLKNGNLLILSNDDKLIFEITPIGELVGFWVINKKWHDNPEGIVFTPEGYLIISDEGSPATIQVYGLTQPKKTN